MPTQKEFTTDELNSLLGQVEKEFSVALKKAEEQLSLSKAEGFPPKKNESKEKDEGKAASESKGASEKPMESEKPADKGVKDQNQPADDKAGMNDQAQPGGQKPPMAAAPAADPAADPAANDPSAVVGAEDHGYDDEDMQHMQALYASMSKPELKAHHDCIRKCMDSMGLAKCEETMVKTEMEDGAQDGHRPNGGPHDGEAASKKTPAASDTQAMTKSEDDAVVSLLKSEIAALKASDTEKQKNLEAVEAFLKKFVKPAPAGKAIVSLDIIAKTESASQDKPLSKSEIDAKLIAKAKDVTLAKSDRDAINSYYCGSKDITKVSHLLK